MKTIFLLLLLVSGASFGQSFFVQPTEKGYEKDIINKLEFAGYKVTNESEADYIVTHRYQKVKSINAGTYEGYILINDKSGKEVFRTNTKKKQANAYNGYQAVPAILSLLTDKELIPKIKSELK